MKLNEMKKHTVKGFRCTCIVEMVKDDVQIDVVCNNINEAKTEIRKELVRMGHSKSFVLRSAIPMFMTYEMPLAKFIENARLTAVTIDEPKETENT